MCTTWLLLCAGGCDCCPRRRIQLFGSRGYSAGPFLFCLSSTYTRIARQTSPSRPLRTPKFIAAYTIISDQSHEKSLPHSPRQMMPHRRHHHCHKKCRAHWPINAANKHPMRIPQHEKPLQQSPKTNDTADGTTTATKVSCPLTNQRSEQASSNQ